MDPASILNAIAAAFFIGAGKIFLDVYSKMAVHDEKHKRHDARLERLEDGLPCNMNDRP